MFGKLQKKIMLTILGATGFFVISISLVTAIVISQSYIDTYKDSVNRTVQIAIDYSNIKLFSIQSDGETLAMDETIVDGLSASGYFTTINPKLNFFRSQYQEEVSGIALYAVNNWIYRTDSMSIADIVPWNELLLIPEIVAFTEGTETSALVLLPSQTESDAISSLAILTKVEENGTILGYLLMAIDSNYLFNKYFTYRDIHDFVLVNNFIVIDSKVYFSSENNQNVLGLSEYNELGSPDGYFAKENQLFFITKSFYREEYQIVTIIDTAPLLSDIWSIVGILGLISFVFIFGSYFIAKKEAGSIARRLTKLQMRMKQATDLID